MSVEITMNSVSVRDPQTGTMTPIGMFGSGADETLAQIKTYADTTKQDVKTYADNVKTQTANQINATKNSAISAMNTRYDEIVEGLPENYQELKDGIDTNKADIAELNESITNLSVINGIEYEVGGVSANGTLYNDESTRTDRIRSKTAFINVKNVTFYTNGTKDLFAIYLICYDENRNFISNNAYSVKSKNEKKSVDIPSNVKYVRFLFNTGNLSYLNDIVLSVTMDNTKTTSDFINSIDSINRNSDNISNIDDRTTYSSVAPYSIGSTNQIARIGWDVYASNTPPEQSIESYAEAYRHGCRIMLCDIRSTSDGTLVCRHDDGLGDGTVTHTDGTALTDDEKTMNVSTSTLEQLDTFDFGFYKGSQYAGTKILKLWQFFEWCGINNCFVFLETKIDLSDSHIQSIAWMLKRYKLADRVIVADGYGVPRTRLNAWMQNVPKAIMCLRGGSYSWDTQLANAKYCKDSGFDSCVSVTNLNTLTTDQIREAVNYGIDICYSEVKSDAEMTNLFNDGWLSKLRYITSSYVDVLGWIANRYRLI